MATILNTNLANQNLGRVLFHERFDSNGFTSNKSLAEMRLTKSDTLNPVITHLMGAENKMFPLTFLTEGQKGGMKRNEIQDVEYNWPVITRMKKSDAIVSHEYATGDTVGRGGAPFQLVFRTNFLKNQHLIHSPNGLQARVQGRPRPVGNGWLYTLRLIYRDSEESVALSEITPNTLWAMVGGAPVSESHSSGNESNKQAPGKLKNQISIIRKSYEVGGNVKERTVEFQFNIKGKTTSYWMPFEEYQHEIEFKTACEEHLWWSRYNRDAQGNITTIDDETGFPIPMGGGINDQIPHQDSYGRLTVSKLHNTVGDVLYGGTDTGNMDVVLFTGKGGAREFDRAIKDEVNGGSSGWRLIEGNVADKFVTGSGPHKLSFGAYFNQYKHVDGHTITIKMLNLLDFGGRADNAPKHPETGWPLTSYEMYFVDMSTYDGERNVQMVSQKGRSMVRGIEQGMTLVKGKSYGDYSGNTMSSNMMNVSTSQDKTSIHFLKTLGVAIRRNTHCFKLTCDLS
jgi:hypothetical protein